MPIFRRQQRSYLYLVDGYGGLLYLCVVNRLVLLASLMLAAACGVEGGERFNPSLRLPGTGAGQSACLLVLSDRETGERLALGSYDRTGRISSLAHRTLRLPERRGNPWLISDDFLNTQFTYDRFGRVLEKVTRVRDTDELVVREAVIFATDGGKVARRERALGSALETMLGGGASHVEVRRQIENKTLVDVERTLDQRLERIGASIVDGEVRETFEVFEADERILQRAISRAFVEEAWVEQIEGGSVPSERVTRFDDDGAAEMQLLDFDGSGVFERALRFRDVDRGTSGTARWIDEHDGSLLREVEHHRWVDARGVEHRTRVERDRAGHEVASTLAWLGDLLLQQEDETRRFGAELSLSCDDVAPLSRLEEFRSECDERVFGAGCFDRPSRDAPWEAAYWGLGAP